MRSPSRIPPLIRFLRPFPGMDAESLAGDECLEEDEEELETSLEDPEQDSVGKTVPGGRSCGLLTRRGITLRVLLKDGLIEPGEGVLSIYYLGKKFWGDLLTDGKIAWQQTGQIFNSPSAWATYCKKLVNPAKKSGCGWASVKYKGQKLDQYKAVWLKKHQPNAPPAEESLISEGEEEDLGDEEEDEAKGMKAALADSMLAKKVDEKSRKLLAKSLSDSHNAEHSKRLECQNRIPVRYCSLGSRDSVRNPHTLVEVTSFAALNKFQPFNVAISSNVLLLVDFHSHLSRSEVVGYLAGQWNINSQRKSCWVILSADGAAGVPLPVTTRGRRAGSHCGRRDLPKPLPAGAVAGGLVSQPPVQPPSAFPARHRHADGLPAEAPGIQQQLPAVPGAHLWSLLPWQPRRRIQDLPLLGDATPGAKTL
ncbi:MPN domain-containing protein isoform X4 [Crotalus tigris]|uniref:MPN domain-containing protein isoform X4 n=1 Tax=Crotalus tigris TaxID=88082 RepID=UPI00192F2DD8|nr:MPN domain-containing protein isoform X4 [Crotalus tigris]